MSAPARPCLLSLETMVGVAAVVPDDQDAHAITDDSIKKVVWEAFQIGSPEVGFVNVISKRPAAAASMN